jgi:hypothetical protein
MFGYFLLSLDITSQSATANSTAHDTANILPTLSIPMHKFFGAAPVEVDDSGLEEVAVTLDGRIQRQCPVHCTLG